MKTAARRLAATTALALAAALAVSGCTSGGAGSAQNQSQQKITLRMIPTQGAVMTVSFWQNLLKPFEKAHPNITVQILPYAAGGASIEQTMKQELAAGDPPDVIHQASADEAPVLSALPKSAAWVKNSESPGEETIDGKQFAVATAGQPHAIIFYNKSEWSKAGITGVPATFDQFTADMKKLKAAGFQPLDISGEWATGPQFEFFALPAEISDNPDWLTQAKAGNPDFTDPNNDFAKVANIWESWIQQGLAPKNSAGVSYNDSITEFTTGKAATYMMASFTTPSLVNLPFQVGVMLPPTFSGKPAPLVTDVANPWAVLKSSKHQAAAMELVKFLVTNKAAVVAQAKADGDYATTFTYPQPAVGQALQKIVDNSKTVITDDEGPITDDLPTGFQAELDTQIQSLFTGKKPAQVLSNLSTWWSKNDGK